MIKFKKKKILGFLAKVLVVVASLALLATSLLPALSFFSK